MLSFAASGAKLRRAKVLGKSVHLTSVLLQFSFLFLMGWREETLVVRADEKERDRALLDKQVRMEPTLNGAIELASEAKSTLLETEESLGISPVIVHETKSREENGGSKVDFSHVSQDVDAEAKVQADTFVEGDVDLPARKTYASNLARIIDVFHGIDEGNGASDETHDVHSCDLDASSEQSLMRSSHESDEDKQINDGEPGNTKSNRRDDDSDCGAGSGKIVSETWINAQENALQHQSISKASAAIPNGGCDIGPSSSCRGTDISSLSTDEKATPSDMVAHNTTVMDDSNSEDSSVWRRASRAIKDDTEDEPSVTDTRTRFARVMATAVHKYDRLLKVHYLKISFVQATALGLLGDSIAQLLESGRHPGKCFLPLRTAQAGVLNVAIDGILTPRWYKVLRRLSGRQTLSVAFAKALATSVVYAPLANGLFLAGVRTLRYGLKAPRKWAGWRRQLLMCTIRDLEAWPPLHILSFWLLPLHWQPLTSHLAGVALLVVISATSLTDADLPLGQRATPILLRWCRVALERIRQRGRRKGQGSAM